MRLAWGENSGRELPWRWWWHSERPACWGSHCESWLCLPRAPEKCRRRSMRGDIRRNLQSTGGERMTKYWGILSCPWSEPGSGLPPPRQHRNGWWCSKSGAEGEMPGAIASPRPTLSSSASPAPLADNSAAFRSPSPPAARWRAAEGDRRRRKQPAPLTTWESKSSPRGFPSSPSPPLLLPVPFPGVCI